MKKKTKGLTKTITLCSSASFFTQVVLVEKALKDAGFKVQIPLTANKMKKSGDFRVETYKTWFKNPKDYKRKTFLMKDHFNKIVEGDAVLVLNYEKNKMPGYIGGAVLGEMVIAFHTKKPIYILNPINKNLGFREEVFAMQPIIINGDFSKIRIR